MFHQSEICAVERRYIRGEPDIIRGHPPQTQTFSEPYVTSWESFGFDFEYGNNADVAVAGYEGVTEGTGDEDGEELKSPSPSLSPSSSGRISASNSFDQHQHPNAGASFLDMSSSSINTNSLPNLEFAATTASHANPSTPSTFQPFRSTSSSTSFPFEPEQTYPDSNIHTDPYAPKLHHGDIMWWHNLKRAGDIPGVGEEYAEMYGAQLEDDQMLKLRKRMKALR